MTESKSPSEQLFSDDQNTIHRGIQNSHCKNTDLILINMLKYVHQGRKYSW